MTDERYNFESRAEQSRAEQSRAEQSRAEQSRAEQSTRIESLDICKGIAIVAVIFGHIAQNYNMPGMMQLVYAFHMPLFFMISGYFISEKQTFHQFIKKRKRSLLVPYGFCCICLIAAKAVIALIKGNNVLLTIGKYFYISIYGSGSGSGSAYINPFSMSIGHTEEIGMLWYILALFWGSVIVKGISEVKMSWLLCLGITLFGIFTSRIIWLPFSLQNGLACSIWIYLGFEIKKNKIWLYQINNLYRKIALTLVCLGFFLISVLFGATQLYRNYYGLGIIDFFGAIGGCVIIYIIADEISKKKNYPKRIFCWLGRYSFLIYSIHFLEEKIYSVERFISLFELDKFFSFIIAFICSFVFCVIGTIAFLKSDRIRKIYFIDRRERKQCTII